MSAKTLANPRHHYLKDALRRAVLRGSVQLAHGGASQTYLDKFLLLGDPAGWTEVTNALADVLLAIPRRGKSQLLAAPELGAVPFAAAVATRLHQPLVLVRRQAKDYGPSVGRLTLPIHAGQPVVLIEDVVTTATTAVEAVDVLRAAGAQVEHGVCLVDREQGGSERLAAAGVQLWALATLAELV